MTAIAGMIERASLWIDHVATAMLVWRERLRPPRFARLLEQDDGSFTLKEASLTGAARPEKARRPLPAPTPTAPFGLTDDAMTPADKALLAARLGRARVEIVLRPERFLFRPLQLPHRAADFLEAIVRSQIDRLTPWGAADAAFGFIAEPDNASERMRVTVAATARTLLSPFVDAARGLGVETVSISTPAPDGGDKTITVLTQKVEGAIEAQKLRRGLAVLVITVAALAIASIMVANIVGGSFESRRDEVNHRIAERRAALRQGGDANSAAALALQQKKQTTPSTVLVYEELSRILPDDAYLTELRIQGDKAEIVGIARDAPALIRLIEQSPHFKAATFFAPTTRAPSETGQHFFIQVRVAPVFSPPEVVGQ